MVKAWLELPGFNWNSRRPGQAMILSALDLAIGWDAARYSGLGYMGQSGYQTNYAKIAFDFNGAAAVPEPATMLLLGTGLAGLAGLKRKKFLKFQSKSADRS